MQVTETASEGLTREYKVVVSAKDIADKLEHRLQELGGQVNIPGFRPGKVPIQILKQRFGAKVRGEIVERAVMDSSSQAISERGLRPAMQPKIAIDSFEDGKDLEYTMAVELLPEIDMMDFAKIEVERVSVEVPDAEVEEALGRIAGSHKKTEPLAKPRKAASGDVLVVDFRGTVDGEEFPGMSAEGHHLELGSNRFVEGFEEQLIGADIGEERQVSITFPEAYANDKLAGKDAVFQVKVNNILESVPLEVDDQLAQTLGEPDLTSLQSKVRARIEQDYGEFTRARLKRAVLDQLAEGHDFPVPPGMLEAEFEGIWKQIAEAREKDALDPDDQGKDEETLKGEYRAIAERRVRLGLLLSEVGRLNEIEVAPEELNRALAQEAQRHPGHEREVYDFYQKNPEALANLRAPIFEDKVIDFIVALAKVEERKVSPEELRDEESGDAPEAESGGAEAKKAKKSGGKAKGGKAKK